MSKANLMLPAMLKIGSIEEIHDQLSQLVATKDNIYLDGSNVESIDGAGAQLLWVCQQEAARQDQEFKLINPSPALVSAIDLLGLTGSNLFAT